MKHMEEKTKKTIVHAVLKEESTIKTEIIEEKLDLYFIANGCTKEKYYEEDFHGSELEDDVEYLRINKLPQEDLDFKYFIYKLNSRDVEVPQENKDNKHFDIYDDSEDDRDSEDSEDSEDNEEDVFSTTPLPSTELETLWDSLVFEDQLKTDLLNFIKTMWIFKDKEVDPNLCGTNNILLLHGPPGTGKTSLCKALAQYATIQMIDTNSFDNGVLVEINAGQLFSKWYGETGKEIHRMFDEIKQIMDNPRTMVWLICDEIESVTSARKNSTSGNECSDSIIAVNTLLTEIDKIKNCKNVLVMATSNITNLIDEAFISRVDIKRYIGLPNLEAINSIFKKALKELQMKGIINSLDFRKNNNGEDNESDADLLSSVSKVSFEAGLSGRTLKKIPFISHVLGGAPVEGVDSSDFFNLMLQAIMNEKSDVDRLNDSGNTS